jgi:hypothetical protein
MSKNDDLIRFRDPFCCFFGCSGTKSKWSILPAPMQMDDDEREAISGMLGKGNIGTR